MDNVKARELEQSLKGKLVGNFKILELLDHGKSAAVFLAEKNGFCSAVKIFDDDLIAQYGDSAQFERIQREVNLKDSPHENLVKIIEGGICKITRNHFMVMEFIEGDNLKNCLCKIAYEDIWSYITQLASAAKHLDDLGYAHRDIKPENIMIDLAAKKLTLMDLGVIKPIQSSDLTDQDGQNPFIGTLQYSSPEYLFRNEEDSSKGWRALTFYQIGAVLHDMIMRYPIFNDYREPYGRLVIAIKENIPIIESDAVDQKLISLAKCCLIKDPQKRQELLNWDSFYQKEKLENARSRITKKTELAKANSLPSSIGCNDETIKNEIMYRITNDLKNKARMVASTDSFPNIEVTCNDDKVTLFLDSAPIMGIFSGLTVITQLEIIDLSCEAVNISYSAQNNKGTSLLDGIVFKGVYDKNELSQGYEDAIYESIDSITQDKIHG